MANKPFAIQGADLTLGGVNLQAGTTGVVIPGVTQATNYTVEEVEEDGDYDNRPSYNAPTVVVIDHAQWNFYSGILTPSSQYVAAQYRVELDDGEIDEISVDVAGTYSDAERSIALGGQMWVTDVPNATSNWNANDWTQIPFLPKFRAGEVENVGGSGSGNQLEENENGEIFALMDTGDVVFDGPDGGVNRGLVWKYGEDYSGVNSRIRQDEDGLTVRAWTTNDEGTYSASVNIVTNQNENRNTWEFDGDGGLTFPDGTTQTTAYTGQSGGGTTVGTWIAGGSNPGGAGIVSSTDGVNWTVAGLGLTDRTVSRVAIGNNRIVYLMNDNNTDDGSIYYALTPGATPTLASGTYAYGEGAPVDWREINYLGGKFVATGAYKSTSTVTANITSVTLADLTYIYPRVTLDNTSADLTGQEVTISGATNPELNGTFVLTHDSTYIEPFTGVYELRQTDYATPATITSTDATGASLTTNTPINLSWPLFIYSTDGVTWTYGDIDPGYFMILGSYPQASMSDVAYDGTGYLIPVIDSRFGGNNSDPLEQGLGAFYITDLTAQVGEGQFIDGVTGLPGRFNNIASYADGTFFVSDDNYTVWTSSDPLNTWTPHDYQSAFASQFGYIPNYEYAPGQYNSGPDVDSAVAGTVDGQQMWAGTINNGQVVYTTDNGSTFSFSTPAPKTHTESGILVQGTTTQISLVNSGYSPQYDEFITIAVGSGDDTRWNGVYRIRPGAPNLFDLFAIGGTDVDSSAWTVPSLPITVTFSEGEGLDAIHIADGVCIVQGSEFMWRSTNMTTWTLVHNNTDYNINDIYYGDLLGYGTGDVTFEGNKIIGTGSNDGALGLNLSPGPGLDANMYFRIHGGDNPTHLHLSVGDTSVYDQYFGNDNKYLKLGLDDIISIGTSSNTWKFGTDGATTFPTMTVPISDNAAPSGTGQTLKFSDSTQQAIIYGPASTAEFINAERVIIQGAPGYTDTTGEGGDVYLWAGPGGSAGGDGGDIKIRAGRGNATGNGGYLNFQAGSSTDGTGGYINIESGSSSNGTGGNITIDANSGGQLNLYTAASGNITLNTGGGIHSWTFDNTGKMTIPGAVVKSTVIVTGVDLTSNNVKFEVTQVDGLTGAVTELTVTNSPNPAWVTNTSGLGLGDVDFSVTFDGLGNASVVVNSGGTGHTVGQTFEINPDAVGATPPTPAVIDLTKSINSIGDGYYTLADGVEGQIMYLVPDIGTFTTSNNVIVTVAHGREQSTQMQDWQLWPFRYWVAAEQVPTSICTLIFTQSHWQQIGGSWD